MTEIENINISAVATGTENYFFGYYDLSPESPDGSRVLVNKTGFIDRMPDINDELELGYVELDSGEYHAIAKTTAWNFQEGCRLQWLDNDRVIFNTRRGEAFDCAIYSVAQDRIVDYIGRPLYSIDKKGDYAVTFSFSNNKYTYCVTENRQIDYRKEGLFLVNINTKESKLLISLYDLIENSDSEQSFHNWVESAVFNSAGDRIYFYHRYETDNGYQYTRLCVSDLEGNYRVLFDNQFLSHSGWRGNDEITAWCRVPGGTNAIYKSRIARTGILKFILKIYHFLVRSEKARQKFTNDAYVCFNIENNGYRKIESSDLYRDGHCTWTPDGRYMLTDTYADEAGYRYLLIYDSKTDEVYRLGKFYSIPKDVEEIKNWGISPMRCDLHPKWSFDFKHIYFDSVHEGLRGLYRIDFEEVKERLAI